MLLNNLHILLLQFTLIQYACGEPFITIMGGLTALVSTAIHYTNYMRGYCDDRYLPADFNKLQTLLDEQLYGQHLAKEIIINALKSHWNNPSPSKPLTLSFHGSPGTGKNYVSKFIQNSIYMYKGHGKYVHQFWGRIHFRKEDNVQQYQTDLYNWIKGNVSQCEKQLFIFDEVDKMPPKILNIIKPIIDYNENVDKVDFRKCVFIFISNTGSSILTKQYLNLWRDGIKREDIKVRDFEKLMTEGAFNEHGGFHLSDTIKNNLIDHYIPFLPMELSHVKKCIRSEFKLRNVVPSMSQIDEVLEYVEWGPDPENVFSRTGCKRLSQKVAVVAARSL